MAAHGRMFLQSGRRGNRPLLLSWDMDGDAVCYALEVTTEDGEVLYADDSVWQNEVIFPADIPSEAEEKFLACAAFRFIRRASPWLDRKRAFRGGRQFSGTGSASSPSG